MAEPQMVDPHDVVMTGENSFIRLSNDGGKTQFGDESLPVVDAEFARRGNRTFLPARSAQLSVNGEAAGAKPFPQERFGKPASSCCLAWSETWTRPRG